MKFQRRADAPAEPDALAVLRFVDGYIREHGFAPSQREIADACNWRAASSANDALRILAEQGLIRLRPLTPRAIAITEAGFASLSEGGQP